MILASAGSGKTHDLTTRFCTLLAAGVEPERILALTFSRKSAGEFFSRILTRLAQAAESVEAAAALEAAICEQEQHHAEHCGAQRPLPRPPLTQAVATGMLVTLVRRLHLLTLSTMDSFFIRMARACPLELGLSGDFGILDQNRVGMVRQRIYQKIFSPHGSRREDQEDFLLAFEQATFGREETSLVKKLQLFTEKHYQTFLEARAQALWGQPEMIWPHGEGPREPGMTVAEAVRTARSGLARAAVPLNGKQVVVLEKFLEEMESRRAGQPVSSATEGILTKLAEAADALRDGRVVLTLARTKVTPNPLLCQQLADVLDAVVRDDFHACLQQTQGIWRILHRYDQSYDALVRQQGELTFADVQQLLSGDLAREQGGEFALARSLLEFRLDAKYDHWLLDEFQDTNQRQWGILAGLVEEILQDDAGTRTFFAVGDGKQAIHMWRGSDPDLMVRLLAYYEAAPQRIAVRSKAVSWRCGLSVLALLNAVFAERERLKAWLPEGTLQAAWNFEPHQTAQPGSPDTGVAEVLVIPKQTAEEDQTTAAWKLICEKVCEMNPLARGLTCVVLVLTNDQAQEVTDYLRANTSFQVTCETDVSVVEQDAACAGLLQLLHLAVHPGDAYARCHLEMSPWLEVARVLTAVGDSPWPLASARVRAQLAQEGFAATLNTWIHQLGVVFPELPAYSRERLRDLIAFATEHDLTGRRDVDEFLLLAKSQTTRESSRANSIQVMTAFKAKGLEWDIVFATGFQSRTHGGVFENPLIAYDAERHISWITQVPRKDLALCNPTIREAEAVRQCWRWRQNICILYVILTRAVHATHVILHQPSEKSDSKRIDTLLLEMLPPPTKAATPGATQELWQHGNPQWYLLHDVLPSAPQTPVSSTPAATTAVSTPRITPTAAHQVTVHFSTARHRALRAGTALHEQLAHIEWLQPGQEPQLPEPLRTYLRQPEIAKLFQPPTSPTRLWREQAFDVTREGQRLSGVFDRVQVSLDPSSQQPTGAILYDFKTDQISTSAELARLVKTYRPQLDHYRHALTQLLGLPAENISTRLVFLRTARIVPCDP